MKKQSSEGGNRRCRWKRWTDEDDQAIQELLGMVFATADKMGRDPTSIANRLYRMLAAEPKSVTPDEWIEAARVASKKFGVKLGRILNGERHHEVIKARYYAWHILREKGATKSGIAQASGFNDATVWYALQKYKDQTPDQS